MDYVDLGSRLQHRLHADQSVRSLGSQAEGHIEGSQGRPNKNFGLQRSPRPEQSDQGAPDQPANIAHQEEVSTDSRSPVSRFGFAVGTTPLVRDLTQGLFFHLNELAHTRYRKILEVSKYQGNADGTSVGHEY
jgi:hypothetical protein